MEQHLSDISTDNLFQQASNIIWVPYNKLHVSNYREVHHAKTSDVVVLKVEFQKITYTRAIWSKYLADSNELLRILDNESNAIHAHFAEVTVTHQTLRGLDQRINPDKPPQNLRDAMKALDTQAWAAAYNSEFVIAGTRSGEWCQGSTKQAYLYGNMGDDVVYIRPRDWWPEPIPEGHVFLLL